MKDRTGMVIKVDSDTELRQLERSDAVDIFHAIDTQREYLGKWLPFVEFTKELSDSEKFVDMVINAPYDKFEYVFTIRKAGEFAGLIGFRDTDGFKRKTEIGYWLSEKYQKQGIITKSVAKLCDFAFKRLKLNKVIIRCAVGNTASRRIPERLGFDLSGIQPQGEVLTGGIYTDLAVYIKLFSDK